MDVLWASLGAVALSVAAFFAVRYIIGSPSWDRRFLRVCRSYTDPVFLSWMLGVVAYGVAIGAGAPALTAAAGGLGVWLLALVAIRLSAWLKVQSELDRRSGGQTR